MKLWWWRRRDSALIIQKKKEKQKIKAPLSPPSHTKTSSHDSSLRLPHRTHGNWETLLQYQHSPLSDKSQVWRQPCQLHHLSQLTFVAVGTQCNMSTLQAKGNLTHISCYLTLVHVQLLSVVCASVWRRRDNDMRDE